MSAYKLFYTHFLTKVLFYYTIGLTSTYSCSIDLTDSTNSYSSTDSTDSYTDSYFIIYSCTISYTYKTGLALHLCILILLNSLLQYSQVVLVCSVISFSNIFFKVNFY